MKIQVVSGILSIFIQAAVGLLVQDPAVCRFTESNQCYVALGRRLHLQMPLEDEDGFNLNIIDETSEAHLILKYKKTQSDPTPNSSRWHFVHDNKTMILTSAESSDTGTYTLVTFEASGKTKSKHQLQLSTEAEVSSVKVSYSCLFSGVMKVFCSADGENLNFSWTSHISTLTQVEDRNSTLILDKGINRKVTCRVKNHVSSDHDTTEVQPCPGFLGFVCVWLFEVFILLSLLVGTFYYTSISRKQRTLENQNQEAP